MTRQSIREFPMVLTETRLDAAYKLARRQAKWLHAAREGRPIRYGNIGLLRIWPDDDKEVYHMTWALVAPPRFNYKGEKTREPDIFNQAAGEEVLAKRTPITISAEKLLEITLLIDTKGSLTMQYFSFYAILDTVGADIPHSLVRYINHRVD